MKWMLTTLGVMVAVAGLSSSIAFSQEESSPLHLGAGLDAGMVTVKPTRPKELNKSGTQFGVKTFLELRSRFFGFMLGAAQQTATVSGDDPTRGVGQELKINSAMGYSGLYVNFGPKMSLGVTGRIHKGASADYGIYRDTSAKTFRDVGTTLKGALPFFEKFNLSAEASVFRATQTSERKVDSVVAGLSATIPVKLPNIGRIEFAAKNPDPLYNVPTTIKSEEALSQLLLKPVRFSNASSRLDDEAKGHIKALVTALKQVQLGSRRIQVSGHGSWTEKTRRTLSFSLARSAAVADRLVDAGIPASVIDVAGYGSSLPDPAIPIDSDQQQRVMVSLSDIAKEEGSRLNSVTFEISNLRIPPSVVHRIDELWTILDLGRILKKFPAPKKVVTIEFPERIIREPGTWERVRLAVGSLKYAHPTATQITLKIVPHRENVSFDVRSDDQEFMDAIQQSQNLRQNLIVIPVAIENTKQMADRLKRNADSWTFIEAKPEMGAALVSAGIPVTRIIHWPSSELWPETIPGFAPTTERQTLVVIHAAASRKDMLELMQGIEGQSQNHGPPTPALLLDKRDSADPNAH